MTQTTVLSGTYEGTVAITVPIQLGLLDLAFDLTDDGGTLTGHVNRSHTLVYDDEPALSGLVDTSVTTPTFTLESALFDDVVSGRHVERQITLVGEVLEGSLTGRLFRSDDRLHAPAAQHGRLVHGDTPSQHDREDESAGAHHKQCSHGHKWASCRHSEGAGRRGATCERDGGDVQ